MSLFGSLFTGVSGLNAQSQATAMISNNIANVNTVGFKRSEAAFFSLVTTESQAARYSPGTVSVNRIQRVNEQGPIQQSSSTTDVSVSGNGFFAVKQNADDSALDEFFYTRNGQFAEDSQGFLRNSAGFYLYGWPLDNDGNLPASSGDLSSLVPVDVAFLGGLTRPTSTADIALNLNADEIDINTGFFSSTAVAGAGVYGGAGFPIDATVEQADFTRSIRVFDSLGSAQDITFEFRKTTGPMANATSNNTVALGLTDNLDSLAGINAGDQFSISDGVTTRVYEINATVPLPVGVDAGVTSVNDLLLDINANTLIDASLTPAGQLQFQHRNYNQLPNTIILDDTVGAGTALFDATGLGFTEVDGAAGTETFERILLDGTAAQAADNPYGTTATQTNQADFPLLANDTTPNTQGWWEVKVYYPDGSEITEGLINFDGDGSLNASPDTTGASTVDIELTNLDWGNGSSPQDIEINMGSFSQFAGEYNVAFADQNGAELGLRTGISIDQEGIVVARFSNGATTDLYKLPLITFANPNGLQEVSGTAYVETEESGEENLREAGEGGAGTLETATLENSNVDLADEFAKLIVSQRAYSANTRVINTVDQMTEDLLRLR